MSQIRATLVHQGLITIPGGFFGSSIYWLRLWKYNNRHIATVTEVPGNPGLSVINGTTGILNFLVDTYGVTSNALILYVMCPPGSPGGAPNGLYLCPDLSKNEFWREVSFHDIERKVGKSFPELPPHKELYAEVLLAGGGVWQPINRPIFEALPVRDIPVPHLPSKCQHFPRFQEIQDRLGDELADREEREQLIGQEFLDSLMDQDRRSCYFHLGNWKDVADESVRIIERLGPVAPEAYIYEANRSKLDEQDRRWLASLFCDPIDVAGGGFTNGQHRACALRFSGAERAALVVGDENLGAEEVVWTYVGGG